jgi:hypothetical protein
MKNWKRAKRGESSSAPSSFSILPLEFSLFCNEPRRGILNPPRNILHLPKIRWGLRCLPREAELLLRGIRLGWGSNLEMTKRLKAKLYLKAKVHAMKKTTRTSLAGKALSEKIGQLIIEAYEKIVRLTVSQLQSLLYAV